MEYLTINSLLLWTVFSFFITIIWSMAIGAPGSNDKANLILTIICGIIALPMTLLLFVIIFGIKLIIESEARK
jgi:hypothetical protein